MDPSQVPPLVRSLAAFEEVVRRLAVPSQAPLAPFTSSTLTQYLSELLGGNAIVTAIALLAQGEAAVSRKTLELVEALGQTVHYPIGAREVSDATRGLVRKYRTMAAAAAATADAASEADAEALRRSKEDKTRRIEAMIAELDGELQTALTALAAADADAAALRKREKVRAATGRPRQAR